MLFGLRVGGMGGTPGSGPMKEGPGEGVRAIYTTGQAPALGMVDHVIIA